MSIKHRVLTVLLALAALTVVAPCQAETPTKEGQPIVVAQAGDRLQAFVETITTPIVNVKDVMCLARNIFFEAANEPEEGKVAVGLVTLNRLQDGRFGQSVCGVVDQRTTWTVPKERTRTVKTFLGEKTERFTVFEKFTVCQFSWRCAGNRVPKTQDERWIESQEIARNLLASDYTYQDLREKYNNALYFHAVGIKPSWSKQKQLVGRIGGHKVYADHNSSTRF
jgi:spore germination cell wall hydrolase CwlJ-like protein